MATEETIITEPTAVEQTQPQQEIETIDVAQMAETEMPKIEAAAIEETTPLPVAEETIAPVLETTAIETTTTLGDDDKKIKQSNLNKFYAKVKENPNYTFDQAKSDFADVKWDDATFDAYAKYANTRIANKYSLDVLNQKFNEKSGYTIDADIDINTIPELGKQTPREDLVAISGASGLQLNYSGSAAAEEQQPTAVEAAKPQQIKLGAEQAFGPGKAQQVQYELAKKRVEGKEKTFPQGWSIAKGQQLKVDANPNNEAGVFGGYDLWNVPKDDVTRLRYYSDKMNQVEEGNQVKKDKARAFKAAYGTPFSAGLTNLGVSTGVIDVNDLVFTKQNEKDLQNRRNLQTKALKDATPVIKELADAMTHGNTYYRYFNLEKDASGNVVDYTLNVPKVADAVQRQVYQLLGGGNHSLLEKRIEEEVLSTLVYKAEESESREYFENIELPKLKKQFPEMFSPTEMGAQFVEGTTDEEIIKKAQAQVEIVAANQEKLRDKEFAPIKQDYEAAAEPLRQSYEIALTKYNEDAKALQLMVDSGNKTPEQAQTELNILNENINNQKVIVDTELKGLYEKLQDDFNRLNTKYNSKVEEEIQKQEKIVGQSINKELAAFAKKKASNPEFVKAFTEAKKRSFTLNEFAMKRGLKRDKDERTRTILDNFLLSAQKAFGGTLETYGNMWGADWLRIYGKGLEASTIITPAKVDSWTDAINPFNVAKLGGQLVGVMGPSITAGIATSYVTGGLGGAGAAQAVIADVVGAVASWGVNNFEMSQRSFDTKFKETGDVALATDAYNSMMSFQTNEFVYHMADVLPFGKFAKMIKSPILRGLTIGGVSYAGELTQEYREGLAEKAVNAGMDPYQLIGQQTIGLGNYIKDKMGVDKFQTQGEREAATASYNYFKETAIATSPLFFGAAGGQYVSAKKEAYQRTEASQKGLELFQKYIVDQNSDYKGLRQTLSTITMEKGSAFATMIAESMYAAGQIESKADRDVIVNTIKAADELIKSPSVQKMDRADRGIYTLLADNYQNTVISLEKETDPIQKEALQKRVDDLKKEMSAFATTKKTDVMQLTLSNGQTIFFTPNEMVDFVGKNPEFGYFLSTGLATISPIKGDFTANQKSTLEAINQKIDEYEAKQSPVAPKKQVAATEETAKIKFATFEDAKEYIAERIAEYDSEQAFYDSDEYAQLYPEIKKVYDSEQEFRTVATPDDAVALLESKGYNVGDKVEAVTINEMGAPMVLTGTVAMLNGRPVINLDENQSTLSGDVVLRINDNWKVTESAKAKPTEEAAPATTEAAPTVTEETKPTEAAPATTAPKVYVFGIGERGGQSFNSKEYATDDPQMDRDIAYGKPNTGVIEVTKKGVKYAVAYTSKGLRDRANREGFLSISIPIPEGATQEIIDGLKQQAQDNLNKLTPLAKDGLIDSRTMQNAVSENIETAPTETPKTTEDAVQEQTAGKVPVQPEATTGQEVAQGKPEAEPQVAAEEGKAPVKENKIQQKVREFVGKVFGTLPENILDYGSVGAGYRKNVIWASTSLGNRKESTSLFNNIKSGTKGKKAYIYFLKPNFNLGGLKDGNTWQEKAQQIADNEPKGLSMDAALEYQAKAENEAGAALAKQGVKAEPVAQVGLDEGETISGARKSKNKNDFTFRIFDPSSVELAGYVEVTPELLEKLSDPNITDEQANQILFDAAGVSMNDNILMHANLNDIAKYTPPKDAQAEEKVAAEDLLNVDTKDKTNLQKVFDFLDKLDNDLDKFGKGTAGMNLSVPVIKAIIKTAKALVATGITLQEAIRRAAAENKVSEQDAIDAIKSYTEQTAQEPAMPSYITPTPDVEPAVGPETRTLSVWERVAKKAESEGRIEDAKKIRELAQYDPQPNEISAQKAMEIAGLFGGVQEALDAISEDASVKPIIRIALLGLKLEGAVAAGNNFNINTTLDELALLGLDYGRGIAYFKEIYSKNPQLFYRAMITESLANSAAAMGNPNLPGTKMNGAVNATKRAKKQRDSFFDALSKYYAGEIDIYEFIGDDDKKFDAKTKNALKVLLNYGKLFSKEDKEKLSSLLKQLKDKGIFGMADTREDLMPILIAQMNDINGKLKIPLNENQIVEFANAMADFYEGIALTRLSDMLNGIFNDGSLSSDNLTAAAKAIMYGALNNNQTIVVFAQAFNIPVLTQAQQNQLTVLAQQLANAKGTLAQSQAQYRFQQQMLYLQSQNLSWARQFSGKLKTMGSLFTAYFYNAILSAFNTMFRAVRGNIGRTIGRVLFGLVRGDFELLRQSFSSVFFNTKIKNTFTITTSSGATITLNLENRVNETLDGVYSSIRGLPKLSEVKRSGLNQFELMLREEKSKGKRMAMRTFIVPSGRMMSAIDAFTTPINQAITKRQVYYELIKEAYKQAGIKPKMADIYKAINQIMVPTADAYARAMEQARQDIIGSQIYSDLGFSPNGSDFPLQDPRIRKPLSREAKIYNEWLFRVKEIIDSEEFQRVKDSASSYGWEQGLGGVSIEETAKMVDEYTNKITSEITFLGRPRGSMGFLADSINNLVEKNMATKSLKFVGVSSLFVNAGFNAVNMMIRIAPGLNAVQLAKYYITGTRGAYSTKAEPEFGLPVATKLDKQQMLATVITTNVLFAAGVAALRGLYDDEEEEKDAITKKKWTGITNVRLTPAQEKLGYLPSRIYYKGEPQFDYKDSAWGPLFGFIAYCANYGIWSTDYTSNKIFVEPEKISYESLNDEDKSYIGSYIKYLFTIAGETSSIKDMSSTINGLIDFMAPDDEVETGGQILSKLAEKKLASFVKTATIPYARLQGEIKAIYDAKTGAKKKEAIDFFDKVVIGTALEDVYIKTNGFDFWGEEIKDQFVIVHPLYSSKQIGETYPNNDLRELYRKNNFTPKLSMNESLVSHISPEELNGGTMQYNDMKDNLLKRMKEIDEDITLEEKDDKILISYPLERKQVVEINRNTCRFVGWFFKNNNGDNLKRAQLIEDKKAFEDAMRELYAIGRDVSIYQGIYDGIDGVQILEEDKADMHAKIVARIKSFTDKYTGDPYLLNWPVDYNPQLIIGDSPQIAPTQLISKQIKNNLSK